MDFQPSKLAKNGKKLIYDQNFYADSLENGQNLLYMYFNWPNAKKITTAIEMKKV